MAQVLLLGSFHFMESPIDFYTREMQEKLAALVKPLAVFEPDAVAIEASAHAQPAVDASYARFSLEALSNPEKMASDVLGTIRAFGEQHPIAYKNEAVQLGYRLGKLCGHERVWAIDDDSLLPEEAHSLLSAAQQAQSAAHMEYLQYTGDAEDIATMYSFINTQAWSWHNHQLYVIANAVQKAGYEGTDFVGAWYRRNLRIFSNLQRLCEAHKRIVVIYGAGHLYLLRRFIEESEDMILMPPMECLA